MSLDVLTPKGQKALEECRIGVSLVPRKFIETDQDKGGAIDGFFLRDDGKTIAAAVEIKSRNLSASDLKKFNDEWLLTFEKVQKGALIAKALCVPFFGLLYLVPDHKTYLIKIADSEGRIVAPMRLDVTDTTASCNGGHARGTNAFISIAGARIYG